MPVTFDGESMGLGLLSCQDDSELRMRKIVAGPRTVNEHHQYKVQWQNGSDASWVWDSKIPTQLIDYWRAKSERKSAFTAMSEHQKVFFASFKGKKVKMIIATVGVQIFDMKRRLVNTLLFTDMPKWAHGKTIRRDHHDDHWVHLFMSSEALGMVERRLEGKRWDPNDFETYEFVMDEDDAHVFTEVLNGVAKTLAKAIHTAETEDIIDIANTAAVSEVKTPRSARILAKEVAHEVKFKVGEEQWDQMKGSAKLSAIRAHAGRDSVHERFRSHGDKIEEKRVEQCVSTDGAMTHVNVEHSKQTHIETELAAVRDDISRLSMNLISFDSPSDPSEPSEPEEPEESEHLDFDLDARGSKSIFESYQNSAYQPRLQEPMQNADYMMYPPADYHSENTSEEQGPDVAGYAWRLKANGAGWERHAASC
jgi:hypothetical protein